MKLHVWTKEAVDGGHFGLCTFWRCSVCGASGGPAIGDSPRQCFLAGPAKVLPKDCNEARALIRKHIDKCLLKLGKLGSKGVSPHYASLLHDMILWTPNATDLTPFVSMIARIESFHDRPALLDVRRELQALGFNTVPCEVSETLDEN